jgi:DNA invertase Pin-like site-specific DNA recombinase
MKPKRIFYGRQSKGEDLQKYSIAAQITLVEDKFGTCAEYHSDKGISGSKGIEKREGLRNAIDSLKRGDELVVAYRDRISRDFLMMAVLEDSIESKGNRILSAAEDSLNNDSIEAVAMKQMVSVMSSMERKLIARRIKNVLAHKKAKGERISGLPEYGFDFAGDDAKSVVINIREHRVREWVKALRGEGWSVAKIMRELNDKKVPTKTGKEKWHYTSAFRLVKRVEAA